MNRVEMFKLWKKDVIERTLNYNSHSDDFDIGFELKDPEQLSTENLNKDLLLVGKA